MFGVEAIREVPLEIILKVWKIYCSVEDPNYLNVIYDLCALLTFFAE